MTEPPDATMFDSVIENADAVVSDVHFDHRPAKRARYSSQLDEERGGLDPPLR